MKNRPLFQELAKLAENNTFQKKSLESLEWYRKKVSNLFGEKQLELNQVFEKQNYPNKPLWGNIVTFKYTPKHKDTLPYYDMYPLVLIIDISPQNFLGLNFHYLRPIDRAIFMDRLYKYQKLSVKDQTLKINMYYEWLQSSARLSYYKPCVKRYRTANIGNMFYTLMPQEWDIALFLPTEKFVGANKRTVWKHSISTIKEK